MLTVRVSVCLTFGFLCTCCAFGQQKQEVKEPKEKVGWVTGYWAGWAKAAPKDVAWNAYTHICIFSATPTTNGGCKLGMGWNDSRVQAVVAEGHQNHVKMLLCVGGEGTGKGFVGATADAAVRATFITNIIALMQKYEFDGVDMDWEELGGKQDQYVAVHKELRAELDRISPRPLLTVAIANWMFNNTTAGIHPYMDQMNNMSYWTRIINNGVVDEAAIAKDMQGLVDKGVPKAKLGVGIGLDYEEGHAEVDCDPAACAAKCRFAISKEFGGVMIWAIEKDTKKNAGKQPCHDALSAFTPKALGAAGATAQSAKRVAAYGYFGDGGGPLHYGAAQIPFSKLTHLFHVAVNVTETGDGSISIARGATDPTLITEAHKAGTKVLACVQGRSQSFSKIATNAQAKALFAANMKGFVTKHNYDGVDIDWEVPEGKVQAGDCTAFMQTLRNTFPSPQYLLSMATPSVPKSEGAGGWGDFDIRGLTPILDFFNIMTYDFHGPWIDHAGHNSPLFSNPADLGHEGSCEDSVNLYVNKFSVPPDKINLGTAFYGYEFASSNLFAKYTDGSKVTFRNYGPYIKPRINGQGWTRHLDPVARNPYLLREDPIGCIVYDDAESIAAKTVYALQTRNLGGVFMWNISYDYDGTNQDLMSSMYQAFLDVTKAAKPSLFKVLVVASPDPDHGKVILPSKPVFEQMASNNNFSIDFCRDPKVITDENLANCQVFVMFQLAPFEMTSDEQAALQKFVSQGKGLVGVHGAGLFGTQFRPDAKYWQWYEDIFGGVIYSDHPKLQKGIIVIEDRTHPITRNLSEKFEVLDEWYEFNKNPRPNTHVLGVADEQSYKQVKPMGDHPMIWVSEKVDRGVYISIGHDASICTNENFTILLRDSILWAATPKAK